MGVLVGWLLNSKPPDIACCRTGCVYGIDPPVIRSTGVERAGIVTRAGLVTLEFAAVRGLIRAEVNIIARCTAAIYPA